LYLFVRSDLQLDLEGGELHIRIMKKNLYVILFVIVGVVVLAPLQAASGRVAVTPKASTLGLGADVSFKVAPLVNVRVSGQQFDYERSDTLDDIPYDIELGLQSFGAAVDVHPFNGSFHLSAGLLANGNEVSSEANLVPTDTYEIGGTLYTGAQLGGVSGSVDFDSTAPYLGVGWGNPFAKERRLGFSFGLGVIRQGVPDISLNVDNAALVPGLDQEIAQEEANLEQEFENFEYFPVVAVGLSIRL
jgi:hypothetical protein